MEESSIMADPCPTASDLNAGKPSVNKIALELLGWTSGVHYPEVDFENESGHMSILVGVPSLLEL